MSQPVVIVGAGMAGLACAVHLQAQDVPVKVFEATPRIGGVVWTDEVDGFLLDNGFHVLLTGFPESRKVLDLAALDIRSFHPGAIVRTASAFERIADPLRAWRDIPSTLSASTVRWGDALRVVRLLADVVRASPEELLTRPATTTAESLRRRGFSASLIDGFFRPFFRGVFLERDLETSSRLFEFIFRSFAVGGIGLPARGMGAVPASLVARLAPGTVELEAPVREVGSDGVLLESGKEIPASAVVVATDARAAAGLAPEIPARGANPVTTFYFDAPSSPVRGPHLVLNGSGEGLVDHLCVPSDVAPGYAPKGRALVSVNLVGRSESPDDALRDRCVDELVDWYGPEVRSWRPLRTVHLPEALPDQSPAETEPMTRPVRLGAGRFVCGGHRESSTLGGALRSGRRAAAGVLAERQGRLAPEAG